MFSKILAFGLGALALVNAATAVFSFQTPMLSCNVNMLGTSQAAVKAFDELPEDHKSGQYKIFNKAFPDLHLVARQALQPVMLSFPGEDPVGDRIMGGRILLRNVGINAGMEFSGYDIIAWSSGGSAFAVERAGEEYVIKLIHEDLVWSLGSSSDKLHVESRQGLPKQLWHFQAVN
ncbi:hypothetical protein K438DRAFT_2019141 [Mycena galopus ATCC 62051]|nr:hypothetical protein K438DRAFT_2019141 [Mycena galopus ATCC 62051]